MSASQSQTTLPATADLSRARAPDPHTGCRREIQRLLIENARLAGDLSDIRARYHDLQRSAEIWITLYERQLQNRE